MSREDSKARDVEYVNVQGPLKTHMAYRLWHEEGVPITKAARAFDVSPEEIMLSFKTHEPLRYRLFMWKFYSALTIASILAWAHGITKRVSIALSRWS